MSATVNRFVCSLVMSIAAPLLFAQAQWDASVSGQINSGDPITSRIAPSVSFNYAHAQLSLQSSATTVFDSTDDFIPQGWQSNNQLNWRTSSNRLSGQLGYVHAETDSTQSSILTTTDNASAGISLAIPQSQTLQHRFSVTSDYRAINQRLDRTDATEVSDRSESFNYALMLATNPRVSLQGGMLWQRSTTGQRVANINISRTFQTPNYSVSLSGAFNQTEIESTTAESVTGSATYQYTHDKFTLNTSLRRNITDTLDVFTIAGLERTFEQVQYVQADQLQIGITDVKPTDSIALSFNYSTGQTNSLIQVETFSQNVDIEFEQWSAQSVFSFANSTQVSIQLNDSKQDTAHSQSLTASIQKVLGSRWTASARLREDLLNDADLSWSLSINYRL